MRKWRAYESGGAAPPRRSGAAWGGPPGPTRTAWAAQAVHRVGAGAAPARTAWAGRGSYRVVYAGLARAKRQRFSAV